MLAWIKRRRPKRKAKKDDVHKNEDSLREDDHNFEIQGRESSTDATFSASPPCNASPQSSPRKVSSQDKHRRSLELTGGDFDTLLVRSRGWVYDPADSETKPHHERQHNRAMVGKEYDKYIFAPPEPIDGSC
ncbi:expressed unknown protein [Seminavis robusta]|uniref:Uncharacterized protein n=1 Tax=Seminavis robusta TaxID=568900 RepID=A0A9N8H6V6_9STRA|nr:expressed unknown protein [Seminavis robusta]|eukprot:Sro123_g059510.1 n/a (132) ;mRNA; f:35441-35836